MQLHCFNPVELVWDHLVNHLAWGVHLKNIGWLSDYKSVLVSAGCSWFKKGRVGQSSKLPKTSSGTTLMNAMQKEFWRQSLSSRVYGWRQVNTYPPEQMSYLMPTSAISPNSKTPCLLALFPRYRTFLFLSEDQQWCFADYLLFLYMHSDFVQSCIGCFHSVISSGFRFS